MADAPGDASPALSCILTPGPSVVDDAIRAEELGYAGVWVNDSPAVFPDAWIVLDRIARRTEAIGLGVAVAVPGVRHVVALASAARTLAAAAPERVAIAVGRGFTARLLLGLPVLEWTELTRLVEDLRSLLRGEAIELPSGATTALRGAHAHGGAGEIPVLVATDGALGRRHARRVTDGIVCDGVFGVDAPFDGFRRRVFAVHGTVLEPGETLEDERVRDAAGPAVAMRVRYLWTFRRRSDLLSLAGGAEWIAAVEAIPEERRALELFGGYFGPRSPLDATVINPTSITRLTLTGTRENVAERLAALRRLGATEFAYRPAGPDVPRELAAFADAARSAAS